MDLSIQDKNYLFSLPMNYYEGNGFCNEEALDKRFCIILIEKGSGFLNINNTTKPFIAPTIMCINEKERVKIEDNTYVKVIYMHPSVINGEFNFINIRDENSNFSLTTIQDNYWNRFFIERNVKYEGILNVGPSTYNRFKQLFNAFTKEAGNQSRDNWPCRSRSFIIEILFLIENVYDDDDLLKETSVKYDDSEFNSILLYLMNNYYEKITINDLTKKFNINRTSLSEKFNKYTGETIISYVNKLRIKVAATMLRDTKLPIAEIMERVGFSDNTHFLRTFKKYMKISPKEYRDQHCWL